MILDVVPEGSAETFISSFKKFISRRGFPAKILSDNGEVFVADITQKIDSFRNVKWDFSLKEAPWYGGFWERLVGQLKRCLKKTIGRAYLNFHELQTVTNEIELVLNSRPLGPLHDDDLEEPLTPNHLFYGRQLHFNNYNDSVEDRVFDAHKRIEYLETVLNHFWNRWRSEYIPSLLEYQKLYKQQNKMIPSIDDIVNIHDGKVPRYKWLLERIYDVITGKDGAIRGAKLFVGKTKKTVERPINKLYPVEYFNELTIPLKMKTFNNDLEEKLQF